VRARDHAVCCPATGAPVVKLPGDTRKALLGLTAAWQRAAHIGCWDVASIGGALVHMHHVAPWIGWCIGQMTAARQLSPPLPQQLRRVQQQQQQDVLRATAAGAASWLQHRNTCIILEALCRETLHLCQAPNVQQQHQTPCLVDCQINPAAASLTATRRQGRV
jgi:hypothetical protein